MADEKGVVLKDDILCVCRPSISKADERRKVCSIRNDWWRVRQLPFSGFLPNDSTGVFKTNASMFGKETSGRDEQSAVRKNDVLLVSPLLLRTAGRFSKEGRR